MKLNQLYIFLKNKLTSDNEYNVSEGKKKLTISWGDDVKPPKAPQWFVAFSKELNVRLDRIEHRLDVIEHRIDVIEQDIKDIKNCPTIKKELLLNSTSETQAK